MYPALEPLKHKRNIRRMDYSIASRVISAIQLIKLGNDDFPVTEDDEDAFKAGKASLKADRRTYDWDHIFTNTFTPGKYILAAISEIENATGEFSFYMHISSKKIDPARLNFKELSPIEMNNPRYQVID